MDRGPIHCQFDTNQHEPSLNFVFQRSSGVWVLDSLSAAAWPIERSSRPFQKIAETLANSRVDLN